MGTKGFIGIDVGTQGLSVIFTNENLETLATGEGRYEMVPGLDEGCYEQRPQDWEAALRLAMRKLRQQLSAKHPDFEVQAIGISGQMHGEVLMDESGTPLGNARLWCDSRNEQEGTELTRRFNAKMPKRMTAVRWLWTVRNQKAKAHQARHMTTPAGWISQRLTGQWNLGIGDAAGMFPINQETLDYDTTLLESFSQLVSTEPVTPLIELLPTVRCAGEDAGTLNLGGTEILGLPAGIHVAAAEGDQPAALAGSLIGSSGMVSVSFGTSVCANSVGDRAFRGVSAAVDHFCAVDGKPINMVWLRNGTTYMNTVVEMFGKLLGGERGSGFELIMPLVVQAPPDCGGVLALPFMDDEPGLGVSRGGTAMLYGINPDNAFPGNAVKAALLSTMFNLRLGSTVLDEQGYPRTELVLSGGLTKTPELAQILADVFETPVKLLESAAEGTAWGAALLAKFRYEKLKGDPLDWVSFLSTKSAGGHRQYQPNSQAVATYAVVFKEYERLMRTHAKFLTN